AGSGLCHHGLPWQCACRPPADRARDERPAARDGDHAAFRPVQSWPADLGIAGPLRDRAPVRAPLIMRRRPGPLACVLLTLLPVISGCAIPAVADPAAAGGVELLDDRILRRDDGPRGIPLGGLSEIADDGQGGYLLISDDRGEYGPPR